MTIRSLWRFSSPPIGYAARHFSATFPILSCLCSTEGCGLGYWKLQDNNGGLHTVCSIFNWILFFVCLGEFII